MKRTLITTFALLYTIILMLGASDRTAAWVARKASAAEEKAQGPGVGAGKDTASRHPNRRIVPSLFVIEPPAAESRIALMVAPHRTHFQSVEVRRPAGSPVPSRAPPQA